MQLIGLIGKKQSGKDTFCAMLAELRPVQRLAFADALKDEVARACQVPLPFVQEYKAEFRPILQWWGTDFRRELCDKNYWIDRLGALQQDKINVITDVRFKNEADFITERDGMLIRIDRPSSEQDPHRSEMEMHGIPFNLAIHNHGTLEDLRDRVRDFVTDYRL